MPTPKASEVVAERIRALIATRRLVPGDALPSETALMKEYGVARPTMREALRILGSDGLVEVHRGAHGGARVRPLDVDVLARRAGLWLQLNGASLFDLSEAGDLIQPGTAALAAERRSPEQLAELQTCAARAKSCASIAEFADVAADMVQLLLRASGNPALELFGLLIEQLMREQFHAHLDALEVDREVLDRLADGFARVSRCIEAQDATGAFTAWSDVRADSEALRGEGVSATVSVYDGVKVRRFSRT